MRYSVFVVIFGVVLAAILLLPSESFAVGMGSNVTACDDGECHGGFSSFLLGVPVLAVLYWLMSR